MATIKHVAQQLPHRFSFSSTSQNSSPTLVTALISNSANQVKQSFHLRLRLCDLVDMCQGAPTWVQRLLPRPCFVHHTTLVASGSPQALSVPYDVNIYISHFQSCDVIMAHLITESNFSTTPYSSRDERCASRRGLTSSHSSFLRSNSSSSLP